MDDIMLSKVASLERCVERVREEYQACGGDIEHDILRQDSIVLNLERACEQCFDMGQRLIRQKKLGLSNEYREIFVILARSEVISGELSSRLQRMVGFRNVAIHEYQELDMVRVKHVIEQGCEDLLQFSKIMLHAVTA